MVLTLRLNKEKDSDLILLNRYLTRGLGTSMKSILLDYFGYVDSKGIHTFRIPQLHLNKTDVSENIKIRFSKEEEQVLKSFKEMDNKSAFLRNLTRMYFGKKLADICRDFFKNNKDFKEVKPDTKEKPNFERPFKERNFERPKEMAIEKKVLDEGIEDDTKGIFAPQEY